jgi:hypothetical protein
MLILMGISRESVQTPNLPNRSPFSRKRYRTSTKGPEITNTLSDPVHRKKSCVLWSDGYFNNRPASMDVSQI